MSASERIVFISGAAEPWGAEHSLRLLAPALRDHGFRVEIWCSSPETARFLRATGVPVRQLVAEGGRLRRVRAFARLIRRERPACVVVFSLHLLPVLALGGRRARSATRFVLDLHDVPRNPMDAVLVRLLGRSLTGLVAISEFVREWAARIPVPTRVVPRPISPVDAAPVPSTDFRVGVVGRVDPEKNIELAIRMVADMPENVRLRVYGRSHLGDGSHLRELQDLADSLAPGRVDFPGQVPQDEVYSNIDVLLVANPNEPSGRTVGEAMIAGIPVVTPDRGGSREYYRPGESGLSYSSGDWNAARAAVDLLRTSPETYRRIALAARSQVEAERSPESVGDGYAQAVRELAFPAGRR